MNKNTLLISLLTIVAITGGLFTQQYIHADKVISGYPVLRETSALSTTTEHPLTEFTLADLAGKHHNISEWKEKIRILNFWASWCPPCLKEIPEFIKIQDEFAEQGIQFIGIAVEDKHSVAEYIKSNPVNYPILIAGDAGIALSRQLGNAVNTVPFTLIVNRNNQIIYRQAGEMSRAKMLELIKAIL